VRALNVALESQSSILEMESRVLRRHDVSLAPEQGELRSAFAALFEKESPPARVRASEPLGFDRDLWSTLVAAGALTMSLPEAAGGDGGGLVDVALVAEQLGRRAAPVPLVEAVVASRVLARAETSRIATLALHPVASAQRQLVPAGAVADIVVGLEGDELVAFVGDDAPVPVTNLGSAPLAWRTLSGPGTRTVLARGRDARERFDVARREWKVLMAAAQTGLAQAALDLGVAYANEREAFGVPIGAFQAVAHALADVAVGVEGSRHLAWRAAWYSDHEPEHALEPALVAYLHAREVANRAASIAIHVQGGFGFTLESDLQLYFRRAKGWAVVSGDAHDDLRALGDVRYGTPG
jgi:alkylation response protein AidB-like acyl-CoA dehydrogenase